MMAVFRARVAAAWPRLVALFIFTGALAAQRTALADLAGDDGLFVVVGRALAHGHMSYAHLPGSPPAVGIGPFYPAIMALIALAWPAYPANEALAALVDAACLAGAAFLTVRLLANQTGKATRYVAVPAAFLAFPVLAEAGARQGTQVGRFVVRQSLQPLSRDAGNGRR